MKNSYILLILFLLSCNQDNKVESPLHSDSFKENHLMEAIKLEVLDYDALEPYLTKNDNKTYVVNFWATWCAPCIKELPYFEKLNENYKNRNVEVLLVSLDFPSQYEKKLKPFIKKHQLKSKILVLDDVNQNRWIPKINNQWDGAIPITIIYNKKERQFYDKTFTYIELENELKQFLK